MTERCARCGRLAREAHVSIAAGGARVCLGCHLDAAPQTIRWQGLERAAHIGRVIHQDVRDKRPRAWTLRTVERMNARAFDPPYSDEKLQALVSACLEREGVSGE